MPKKARTSIIDPNGSILLQSKMHAVGIFRKPEGDNPEHAFLVVEKVQPDGSTVFWKTGFFKNKDGSGNGLVHTSDEVMVPPGEDAVAAFKDEVLDGDWIIGKCWPLPAPRFSLLENAVAESAKNPGKYNLGGDVLSSGHSAAATMASEGTAPGTFPQAKADVVATAAAVSGPGAAKLVKQVFGAVGQNCFTWARDMLKAARITKGIEPRPEEFFAGSRVSKHLPVPKKGKHKKQAQGGGGAAAASRLGAPKKPAVAASAIPSTKQKKQGGGAAAASRLGAAKKPAAQPGAAASAVEAAEKASTLEAPSQ